MILATVFVSLYFFLPIALEFLASLLVRQDPLQPSDIVVALGGGRPCQRPHHAIDLYRRGLARKVVISGLADVWGPDAKKVTRESLINLGASESDLIILDDTLNTRKEADILTDLMRKNGWQSALIVTDPYHVRRARYTMQQAAPDLAFYAAPVPPGPAVWSAKRWWTRRSDMWLTVREFAAWINTLVGGLR